MKLSITNKSDKKMFLLATFALAVICTIQGEEKQHSARWNRTRSAEEAILRICDMYVPNGMDSLKLDQIWDLIDGPVMDVFQNHAEELAEMEI